MGLFMICRSALLLSTGHIPFDPRVSFALCDGKTLIRGARCEAQTAQSEEPSNMKLATKPIPPRVYLSTVWVGDGYQQSLIRH
eukprot:1126460-Amphidinium_carterae.1